MSSVRPPQEKKRLAYARDHYNRNGESNKAWRKSKALKKAKSRRAYRKKSNDMLAAHTHEDGAPVTSIRKLQGARALKIADWGSIRLCDFVAGRKQQRQAMVGARKARKARRG